MTGRPSAEREGIIAQRDDADTGNDEKQESLTVALRPGHLEEYSCRHLAELKLREHETRSQLVNAKAKLQLALQSAGIVGAGRGRLRRKPQSARQQCEALECCESAATPANAAGRGRLLRMPIPEADLLSKGSVIESIAAPRRVSVAHLEAVKQEATQRWNAKKELEQTLTVCFVGKLEHVDQGEADDRVKCARGTVRQAVGIHTNILVMAATTEDNRPTAESAKYRQYLKLKEQGKTNPRVISEDEFLEEFPARGSSKSRAANTATASPSRSMVPPTKSPRSGRHSPRARAAARCALSQVPSESDLQAFYDYNAQLRQSSDNWIFETCPVYDQRARPVHHEQTHWEAIRDAGKWHRQLRHEVDRRLSNKAKVDDGVGGFKDWFCNSQKSPESSSSKGRKQLAPLADSLVEVQAAISFAEVIKQENEKAIG
eukprot:TRINITY_DN25453_c0_g1_i2.p1 TRINITY_DN25453_c0_g1~~TRINITY_DN25453_c0_g1_i2.p1  ORF type:complete len:431 (+),score=73.49 TRINITY_DN25453_c0_g1_i2:141-1433(+)